jgi:hypothetical protein
VGTRSSSIACAIASTIRLVAAGILGRLNPRGPEDLEVAHVLGHEASALLGRNFQHLLIGLTFEHVMTTHSDRIDPMLGQQLGDAGARTSHPAAGAAPMS